MGKGRRALSLQTVDLKVRMCCSGCERVVKNALLKVRGVDSVEVDVPMEKVTVTGYVDQHKILKEVRRKGKRAEFWPNPDLPMYFTCANDYFRDEESFRESYNYWRHGYNGDKHGQISAPPRGEDRVSNIFNDDDVHACIVM
ncbi:Heavy metal-associated isoprenylated plant protein 26 [Rhynchospora pubera]|uniref:Heavy metal-associated isoprenylated plant protein 26 n=1 Tax=Rhynchospora pubera TaxID=906938 RepID=A0AAV8BTS1_9POAL|nr:Heavy metal-associated isoprenylated plant protein 26 [Rhynchospora pubera]KAJ4759250.1 Heavy metal-associated isoprenylated plant protein 26 [Rhynchospora pubera]KAJ4799753.1 Heavy metal-associated isoprenylated plant protein 26 [Rhynchospora pubera]KAJ4811715.1 Heavy metal-associated isoprenylated plant protein 26 [Rhynchospora pubera]